MVTFDARGGVLKVAGEIDDFTAQELRLRLLQLTERAAQVVEVDLAGVTFIDSSGVAVLASARRQLHRDGRTLLLVGASETLRGVLRTMGLERLLSD